MKRTLLSIIAIIALSMFSFGQHWVDQGFNWTATSRGVQNISAVSDQIAWAAGYDGSGSAAACQDVAVTSNGGTTWTAKKINGVAGVSISMITAFDANTAWCATYKVTGSINAQGIYKTVDGGSTWVRQGTAGMFTGSASFPDIVYFWDANNGVSMGDPNPANSKFEIYTTVDGGTTWTVVNTANLPTVSTGEYGYTSNCYVVGDHIWFGTNKGHIYHSPDKGLTWTAVAPVGMTGKNTWPAMKDALNGFCMKYISAADTINLLDKTTDGGATYTAFTFNGQLFNGEMDFITGTASTYAATGVDGTYGDRLGIVYSWNDGANFNSIDPDLQGTQVTTQTWVNDSVAWAGIFNTATTDGVKKLTAPAVPAVADFTANATAIAKDGSVVFTNISTGNVTSPCSYSWTFQGGTPPSSSSKNPSAVVYHTPGTYNVTLKVTNAFGSVNTMVKNGYIYVGGVGVGEASQANIKVYPNPVKDIMTIESGSGIQQVQVFSITGQMLINQQADGKTVTLSTSLLKSGVYFLKVTTDNGSFDKKIVVQ
ncbi:MAG: T9SS type A sorting domain-containing protein [Bacteroidetes bacterium]|nr:T9SS type A sorting domain-containing protein [Bacteroidota bacterium]